MSDLLIGWDVGGAHLKRAVLGPDGTLVSIHLAPCALWQGLDRLREAMATMHPVTGRSVVTMTGELVDLWPDRATGVIDIATELGVILGTDTRIYAGRAGFVSLSEAHLNTADIASANWHATAAALAAISGDGILADIGSTTTDLIPFAGSQLCFRGYSDAARLETGELVYTGAARTPVMALAQALPFRGRLVPLMAEYFATTADVHRLTGELPDGADLHPAADGGEKTCDASARRLLRMVGRDLGPSTMEEAKALAAAAAEVQMHRLHLALAQVLSSGGVASDAPLIGAGIGRFLVGRLAQRAGRPYLHAGLLLAGDTRLAGLAADCAPAVAVARLALN
ncbi:hydantoinase/oxoprolinase family protein [Xanthobacter flavus]|uniref:hydantoinase/oxoprolinase family protein n=1 Tax=Xanthobacter flavus TaxID=281 RepID=UPI003728CDD1